MALCAWNTSRVFILDNWGAPPSVFEGGFSLDCSGQADEGRLQLAQRLRRGDRRAAGTRLAPRTLRHQHRRRGKRPAWRGDRSRSQFQSPRLPRPFRNRPRSLRDLQAAAEARRFEAGGKLCHALHTFDYDKVRDHKIVVRRAKQNEKMKTLDGVERQFDSNICMITDGDGSRPIGIGGIMGGAETEISFSTKNVLIECAWFEPIAIRRAARFLKLHTEASTRFGRGADPEMAELASRRAAELILQLAGGELLAGVVDIYPGKRAPKKIRVTRAEILRVMGADVPDKEIEASLGALGFAPVRIDQNRGAEGSLLAAWECTQPSWRAEVEREIDLIEEIARVYGLDKFPPRLPAARQGAARPPHGEAETRLRERLIGLGYREIVTIPHVAEERDALFRPEGVSPARLSNPLSEEANVLRATGTVTMAAALEWNLNHGQPNARFFEIGRHYRLHGSHPVETRVLTIGVTGEAREKGLYDTAR